MEALRLLTTLLGAFAFASLLMSLIGFALCDITPLKKVGHFLIAVFCFDRIQIMELCPYHFGECRIWNCPLYGKCPREPESGKCHHEKEVSE